MEPETYHSSPHVALEPPSPPNSISNNMGTASWVGGGTPSPPGAGHEPLTARWPVRIAHCCAFCWRPASVCVVGQSLGVAGRPGILHAGQRSVPPDWAKGQVSWSHPAHPQIWNSRVNCCFRWKFWSLQNRRQSVQDALQTRWKIRVAQKKTEGEYSWISPPKVHLSSQDLSVFNSSLLLTGCLTQVSSHLRTLPFT